MEVHDKIRVMRELKQWSQEDMAEKLSMSPSGYAKIERGTSRINLDRLAQIAEIFQINLFELLQDDNKGWVIQLNDEGNNNNSHIAFYHSANDLAAEVEKLNLVIRHKEELLAQQIRENEMLREVLAVLKRSA